MGKIEEKKFNQFYYKIKDALRQSSDLPYYEKLYNTNNIHFDKITTYEKFKSIPITTKDKYRNNSFDFINKDIINTGFSEKDYKSFADNFQRQEYAAKYNLDICRTSGSTGQPLEIFKHFADIHSGYFALNIYRNKIYCGLLSYQFAWIWPINPITRKECIGGREKFKEINKYGYLYYIYRYSNNVFQDFLDFIILKDIKWIVGAPSVIMAFSEFLLGSGASKLGIKYIECHSEYLFNWQKKLIINAFNINPVSVYSSNEIHFIAATCSFSNMHILEDNVFIELIKNSKGVNEVIATTLNCKNMPLIRYRLGDCAEWSEKNCNCQFKSPIINLKSYRINDLIVSKDKEYFEHWIVTDSVLFLGQKNILKFDQYQVIQKRNDFFVFIIRTKERILLKNVKEAREFLEDYFSEILKYPVCVDIKIVKSIIPNDPVSGKFKYFICEVGG